MSTRKCFAILLGTLLLPGLVGCGPRAAAPPRAVSTIQAPLAEVSTQNPASSRTPTQPPFAVDSSESVKLARQDLAQRLGLPVESVTATAVIGQEFSSEAFYCQATKERAPKEPPPADMAGFSILLEVAGRRYEYHASGAMIAFCRPLP